MPLKNSSPPGLSKKTSRKFRVNKSQRYNKKQNNNNNYEQSNYNKKKRDNIFLLTRDNYYFILEKRYVKYATFFQNLFDVDSSAGHLRNPIYLQKVNSTPFKYIIQYLKRYDGTVKDNKFESYEYITMNDLYYHYDEQWDKDLIADIIKQYKEDTEGFQELLKTLQYIGVFNMYRKVKFAYDFVENTKAYGLDGLDNDFSDLEIEDEEEVESETEEIDY